MCCSAKYSFSIIPLTQELYELFQIFFFIITFLSVSSVQNQPAPITLIYVCQKWPPTICRQYNKSSLFLNSSRIVSKNVSWSIRYDWPFLKKPSREKASTDLMELGKNNFIYLQITISPEKTTRVVKNYDSWFCKDDHETAEYILCSASELERLWLSHFRRSHKNFTVSLGSVAQMSKGIINFFKEVRYVAKL